MEETDNSDNVYRFALYVGSFAVEENDHKGRTSRVQQELEALRKFDRFRKVLICISTKGIKICSCDKSSVFMAHALRRISYATCDSSNKQVTFLAREPISDASLQYCHVFSTETSAQAEELNRIIGDAFQLAYIQQRLHRTPQTPDASTVDQGTGSSDQSGLPRLCDRHPRWLRPHAGGSRKNSATIITPSVLSILEIPPPPACPPPPPIEPNELIFTDNSKSLSPSPPRKLSVSPSVCPKEDKSKSLSPPTVHTALSDNSTEGRVNGVDEVESRLHAISTSQAIDLGFRRYRYFNNDAEKRLSGISDIQVLGGSTRQPRRRQGLGWANLFASSRHSAFIPRTTKILTSETLDSKDATGGDVKSSRKPQIFFDLRTFAGGSPVVALKERLDAQAAADAKASAFAEAAAVLAAAKQASINSPTAIGSSSKPSVLSGSDSNPVVSSTSPCSTTSTHSEPGRHVGGSGDSRDSPPTPPVRINSLRHITHRMSTPSIMPTNLSSSSPLLEGVYDEADPEDVAFSNDLKPHSRNCDIAYRRVDGHSRGPYETRVKPDLQPSSNLCSTTLSRSSQAQRNLTINDSRIPQMSTHSHVWNPDLAVHSSVHVHDRRSHRLRHPHHIDSGGSPSWQTTISVCPARTPLHVAVSKSTRHVTVPTAVHVGCAPSASVSCSDAPFGCASNVMSTSTASAETPTPTATPTPTPTQTPQPVSVDPGYANDHRSVMTGEDLEFLMQAPWYQALLPREVAFELLAREEIGRFIVRNSTSHPDCYALSVRVPLEENPTGITHYLIQQTTQGVRLKGLDKTWPSIRALITHLTVIPEILPCTLCLSDYTSNPVFAQVDDRPIVVHQRNPTTNPSSTNPLNFEMLQPVTSLSCRFPPINRSRLSSVDPIQNGIASSVSSSFQQSADELVVSRSVREELSSYDARQTSDTRVTRSNNPERSPVEFQLGIRSVTKPNDCSDEEYQVLSDFSSILAT